ncbi:MAG: flagellar basal-body MS-ring/collar protein FliF [Chloroflexota bacterium]
MVDRQAILINPTASSWLGRLTRNQQIALGILGLVSLAVIAWFANQARGPEYVVAFTNMRDDDTAAVVAKLKDAKIPYELVDRGTVKIPATQLQDARLMMATQGVQSKGSGVGFELFNEPHFGQTEFAEKVNYQRALEGELSRTIGRIDAVEAARVHLVIPQPSLFVSQQKEASASIIVQMKTGRRLDSAQIQGVTGLVAGSVESLKAANVTVMDTAGNVLSDKQGANDPTRQTGTRTDVQRSLETRIEQDIRTMLFQVVGPDKAIVRVNADLNWDQYESSSETFSPENKQPQIRSQRTVSDSQAQGAAATGGVPGTDSNVPTYPGGAQGGGTQGQTDRRDQTTNYELSKTIEKLVRAPGGVRRLSVAVALDSETVTDGAQADAISRLVATAAGLNTDRGDLVTLTSMPFIGAGVLKPVEAAEQARQLEMVLSVARMVAMVLGPLMVVLMIWMILRKGRPRPQPVVVNAAPASAGALTASEIVEEEPATPLPVRELLGSGRKDPEQERVRRELQSMAESNPASVAQLIRSWLAEDHR